MAVFEAQAPAPKTAYRRTSPPPAGTLRKAADFRPDIQGLRALAVSLVLLFHLWPNRLGGGYIGVDIFFVISGFLITSHLLARPPGTGKDLATFWARRIRRLLPAAFVVLSSTLVTSRLVAPETQWGNTAREIAASALYVVNWTLASSSVNYLSAENAPSPVQHFWSLSVEEQFYLIWPVLILLLVLLARKRGWSALRTTVFGLGTAVALSLAYSVYATATTPTSAYFVTPTRIWELGVGGLIAALMTLRASQGRRFLPIAASGPARTALTAIGLGAIFYAAFAFSGATPFPGWHALIPVLGVALLIGIGAPERPTPGDSLLANRPAQKLGDISYSVYLWHWPMIVLLPNISGDQLGRLDKIVIIIATLVLAALTKTFIEDRYRPLPTSGLRSTYVFAIVGMAIIVGASMLQQTEIDHRQSQSVIELQKSFSGSQKCFGANALAPRADCAVTKDGPIVPEPVQAVNEKSAAYERNCVELEPFNGTSSCTFGDPDGDVNIALIGNSHAAHWLTAVDLIAKKSHWKVTTYFASQCTPSESRNTQTQWSTSQSAQKCFDWGQRVRQKLIADRFDLVITSNSSGGVAQGATDRPASLPIWEKGYRDYFAPMVDKGIHVIDLHDVPYPYVTIGPIPDCVAKHRKDLLACAGPRDRWIREDPTAVAIAGLKSPRATVIDLNNYLCTRTICPAVVGGVLVYYDGHHMTKTYVRTLVPFLAGPLSSTVAKATR